MILDDMKAKILRGEYPVGSKLPSERELSEYYNVSRIPVREALKALSDMGILEIKRGAGTFVKKYGKRYAEWRERTDRNLYAAGCDPS